MRSSQLVLTMAAVPFSTVAQGMIFDSPALNEVVNGGSEYVVNIHSSPDDPYLSQLDNFELLLLSGKYSLSEDIYTWSLKTINPATTQSSIIIPPYIALNGENAYFMGIRGSLKSNSSVSATYFSNYFTLANMTGTESGLPPNSKSIVSPSSSNKFPVWAFIVILGTAILSLSLSWGFFCCRMKRKERRATKSDDCEKVAAEKWYGSPSSDPKTGRIIKHNRGRSASSPVITRLPALTGGPRRVFRPRSTTLSGNYMFELDASEIRRPANVWRDSWCNVRGLVVGEKVEIRTSRTDKELPVLPKVPIPKGAIIERRSEVRWKPSYSST